MQDEGRALAGLALDLGPAAVQFDQRLDQGQADARPAALAPHEAVEDVGLQVIGDAAPGVLDADADLGRRWPRRVRVTAPPSDTARAAFSSR